MECPRCGGRLDRYELGDRVEATCVDCGYVGVPVDHESERPADEAWPEVVDRYEQAFDAGDVDTGPAPPTLPDDDGDPKPATVRSTTTVDPPDGDATDNGADGKEAVTNGRDADGKTGREAVASPDGTGESDDAE